MCSQSDFDLLTNEIGFRQTRGICLILSLYTMRFQCGIFRIYILHRFNFLLLDSLCLNQRQVNKIYGFIRQTKCMEILLYGKYNKPSFNMAIQRIQPENTFARHFSMKCLLFFLYISLLVTVSAHVISADFFKNVFSSFLASFFFISAVYFIISLLFLKILWYDWKTYVHFRMKRKFMNAFHSMPDV